MKNKRPGLKQIANATGKSIMTVQRTIAMPHLVAKETREYIERVMDEMGYIPDRNAASLVLKSTGFIGVALNAATDYNYSSILDGITDFSRAAGRELLLGQTGYDESREVETVRTLLSRRPDGLIVTFEIKDQQLRHLLKRLQIPVVEILGNPARPADMVVGIANEEIGASAARHLLRNGRVRPCFFGQRYGRDELRYQGFVAACRDIIGCEPLHISVGSGASHREERFDQGHLIIDRIKGGKDEIDCIFAPNDVTVAGVVFAAVRNGIKIPDDIAICGLGDLPFAEAMVPSLTTIRLPGYEIGRKACELIFSRLTNSPATRRILMKVSIVSRETSFPEEQVILIE